MASFTDRITDHYGDGGLHARIESALREAGLALDVLTPKDLAPVDEFHSRGRQATKELAALAAPEADDRVIDVGAGIGGPARYLADTYRCDVTGVDLTPEFCEVGNWLCACTGLANRVRLRIGSGTDLPFDDGEFDLAWCIQMQMNVEDKPRLYSEIHRVLKPGGRFVMQELCAGEGGPCHLPAPWASDPAVSFLVSPDALRETVEGAGFETESWRDTTKDAIEWYRRQNARPAHPSPLGIHLVMGAMNVEKRANVERNYAEGRLHQVMGAFHK